MLGVVCVSALGRSAGNAKVKASAPSTVICTGQEVISGGGEWVGSANATVTPPETGVL